MLPTQNLAAQGTKNSRKLTAYRVEDSTSIVMTAPYNRPAPAEAPMAFRMFRLCRMSRITIMNVRRTLSESETAKYEKSKSSEIAVLLGIFSGSADWYMHQIPVTALVTLAESIAVESRRIQVRTKRSEVHQAGDGNSPVIRGIDNVATIELG